MPSTLRRELARKAIHLASSAVPVAYLLGAPRGAVLAALCVAGVTAVAVETARRRSARARAAFDRAVGVLLRAHERDRWSGATWMCLAYALAALAFPRREAAAAMLAVAVGDASAAVVGRLAAQVRRGGSGAKTWEGSVACAAASALAALLVAGLSAPAALACGLAAALAERPRGPLDDNVRIAAAAGAAAWGAPAAVAWAAGALR